MLAAVLGRAVYERLELIEEIADRGDDASVLRLARHELPRVLATLATILRDHEPDGGRCPRCGGWPRRRPHPCTVWQTAHHLITDERHLPARFDDGSYPWKDKIDGGGKTPSVRADPSRNAARGEPIRQGDDNVGRGAAHER